MPEQITGAIPVDVVTGNCVCRVARTAAGTIGAKRADRTDWPKKNKTVNVAITCNINYTQEL